MLTNFVNNLHKNGSSQKSKYNFYHLAKLAMQSICLKSIKQQKLHVSEIANFCIKFSKITMCKYYCSISFIHM